MEVVGSIANELITRGWTKKSTLAADGRVCLVGAAAAAHGALDSLAVTTDWPRVWTGEAWASLPLAVQTALLSAVGLPVGDLVDVFTFNDSHDRDEVLRVAKHADELLSES